MSMIISTVTPPVFQVQSTVMEAMAKGRAKAATCIYRVRASPIDKSNDPKTNTAKGSHVSLLAPTGGDVLAFIGVQCPLLFQSH